LPKLNWAYNTAAVIKSIDNLAVKQGLAKCLTVVPSQPILKLVWINNKQ
jgi:hypothetical protein